MSFIVHPSLTLRVRYVRESRFNTFTSRDKTLPLNRELAKIMAHQPTTLLDLCLRPIYRRADCRNAESSSVAVAIDNRIRRIFSLSRQPLNLRRQRCVRLRNRHSQRQERKIRNAAPPARTPAFVACCRLELSAVFIDITFHEYSMYVGDVRISVLQFVLFRAADSRQSATSSRFGFQRFVYFSGRVRLFFSGRRQFFSASFRDALRRGVAVGNGDARLLSRSRHFRR